MRPGWVDAHCHLGQLKGVRDVARSAVEQGVTDVVVVGTAPSTWSHQSTAAQHWREQGGYAWTTIGLHPWTVAECSVERELEDLASVLRERPASLVAIGELGLDYRAARTQSARAEQLRVFRLQLDLARHHNLPIVLHSVKADDAVMAVLKNDGLPSAGGMVHGFTGSKEQALAWVRAGLHLSIGGAATWRASAKRTAGIQAIPADRLLVETDAPDQPIASRRSRPGEPADLIEVVHALAHFRDASPAILGHQTAQNARRLLGLDRAA